MPQGRHWASPRLDSVADGSRIPGPDSGAQRRGPRAEGRTEVSSDGSLEEEGCSILVLPRLKGKESITSNSILVSSCKCVYRETIAILKTFALRLKEHFLRDE